MANQEQLDILKQGVEVWNQWREEHPDIHPYLGEIDLIDADLSGADLSFTDLNKVTLRKANLSWAEFRDANLSNANLLGADLSHADLSHAYLGGAILLHADFSHADLSFARLNGADLSEANLSDAYLYRANFDGAILQRANLTGANLTGATFQRANLRLAELIKATLTGADLIEADLNFANLTGATLTGARLSRATLVETNFVEATLTNCRIYGISAWNVQLEGAKQDSLVITREGEPTITVDNLEIAQFIYLLLNNPKIRDVIDTIAKKAVLILGRFTPERKAVLDALREALRTRGYVPILFDFEKPSSRDVTETVSILAHLARFIVADLTEPSSIPKELETIIPTLAIPVQPLLEGSTRPYAMFKDYWKYQWVLEVYRYNGLEELLTSLKEHVIEPAERKAKELAKLRAQEFEKP